MTLRNILAAACLLLPLWASAHNIEKGQRVPPVGIADRGELILDNDKFSYKPWNSAQLAGKVRVVQHIAGRTSAKEKNASLVEAINADWRYTLSFFNIVSTRPQGQQQAGCCKDIT